MKELLKKKTTWAGLAIVVTGIGTIIADGDTSRGLQLIFEGLALVFLRAAVAKVTSA